MHPRQKKLLLVLLMPWFFLLYIGAVLALWDLIPDHWAFSLIFFIIFGVAWAFPMKPVMAWMNKYPVVEED